MLQVREMTKADLKRVAVLRGLAFADPPYAHEFDQKNPKHVSLQREKANKLFEAGHKPSCLVAEVDGEIIGAIFSKILAKDSASSDIERELLSLAKESKVGYMNDLIVHPDFQKQKIATELIRRARENLEGHVESVVGHTSELNTRALNMYLKTGKVIGKIQRPGKDYSSIVIKSKLEPPSPGSAKK
jgi:ribosomal protein S18 acetylase RimI-like enzyme